MEDMILKIKIPISDFKLISLSKQNNYPQFNTSMCRHHCMSMRMH